MLDYMILLVEFVLVLVALRILTNQAKISTSVNSTMVTQQQMNGRLVQLEDSVRLVKPDFVRDIRDIAHSTIVSEELESKRNLLEATIATATISGKFEAITQQEVESAKSKHAPDSEVDA